MPDYIPRLHLNITNKIVQIYHSEMKSENISTNRPAAWAYREGNALPRKVVCFLPPRKILDATREKGDHFCYTFALYGSQNTYIPK